MLCDLPFQPAFRDQHSQSQYRSLIGEFLAAKQGLGYLIIYASQIFKLNYLIAALMVLCLIALILYTVIQKFEHQIKRSRS